MTIVVTNFQHSAIGIKIKNQILNDKKDEKQRGVCFFKFKTSIQDEC